MNAQLEWVVDASARAPLPEDEIRRHLAAGLLEMVGGPAGVNAALIRFGPLTLDRILTSHPDRIEAAVHGTGAFIIELRLDAAGLVAWLNAVPDNPVPTSWAELDARLAELGPRVSFAAAEIEDGRCDVVHGVDENRQRPMGSAFKLYLLGALAQAVADGRASWTERLAIRDEWKSLPSGVLQDQPAGAELPLAEYADKMMALSDNTATDHLLHRLGREAIERQLTLFGNQDPQASAPFLSTKAFFHLKATSADAYLALPPEARLTEVERLERLPLDGVAGWPKPEKIDEIEWFGSPADVCRAFSGLWQQNQPEIGHALSINDDGLGLDRAEFPAVWYKGGSEPGVITMNYLARTAGGRTLVTSVMVSDPDAPLDLDVVAGKTLAVVRGAFGLLAATLAS